MSMLHLLQTGFDGGFGPASTFSNSKVIGGFAIIQHLSMAEKRLRGPQ